jgi:hypothetical protein
VAVYRDSNTGADDGQRFAAFRTARSGGMTNCSRTDVQKLSSGAAGADGRGAGFGQATLS